MAKRGLPFLVVHRAMAWIGRWTPSLCANVVGEAIAHKTVAEHRSEESASVPWRQRATAGCVVPVRHCSCLLLAPLVRIAFVGAGTYDSP